MFHRYTEIYSVNRQEIIVWNVWFILLIIELVFQFGS